MQFNMSYLFALNELVGLIYVQNWGLLIKRVPGPLIVLLKINTLNWQNDDVYLFYFETLQPEIWHTFI